MPFILLLYNAVIWTTQFSHAVTYFGGTHQAHPSYAGYRPVAYPPYPPYPHHGYALDIDTPEYPYFGPPVHFAPPPAPVVQVPYYDTASAGLLRASNRKTLIGQTVTPGSVVAKPAAAVQTGSQILSLKPAVITPQAVPYAMPYAHPAPVYPGFGFANNARFYKRQFEGRSCGPPATPSPQFRAMQREMMANNGQAPEHEATFECDCRERRSCTSPDRIMAQHARYCGGAQATVPRYNRYVCCCQYGQNQQFQ